MTLIPSGTVKPSSKALTLSLSSPKILLEIPPPVGWLVIRTMYLLAKDM